MKLILFTIFIACSYAAKLDRAYLPPDFAQTSGGSADFLKTPLSQRKQENNFLENNGNQYTRDRNGFVDRNLFNGNQVNDFKNYDSNPERPRAALERNAAILRQFNNNDGETYSYAFETENGIYAEESGVATNGVEAQGGYSYTGDDGRVYSIRYTAGQNGFIPEGDHLPTPPPIPEEIMLALEQNARDEAAGIYDDGSYTENKYSNGDSDYKAPIFGNTATGNEYNNAIEDDSVVINSALNQGRSNQQIDDLRNTDVNQAEFKNGQIRNNLNRAYLPPNSERFSSRNQNRGNLFGNRNRSSSFSSKNGYNY